MTDDQEARTSRGAALRTARVGRGWSQSRAAGELRGVARRRGGPDASAASLKTQLSRWENGHALPDPEYRELLAELYGRSAEDLGLLPRPAGAAGTAVADLRSELAAAAAVGPPVLAQWRAQLAAAHRLDDELGAAGSGEVTAALTAQLGRTLAHTHGAAARAGVAALLAGAAELAGRHALDRADPAGAWERFTAARSAAGEAGSGPLVAVAATGQADVLLAIGEPEPAAALLDEVVATHGSPGAVEARLAAALGMAWAAQGRDTEAREAFRGARGAVERIDVVHPADVQPVTLVDVHRWHGHALVTLHDPRATEPLTEALTGAPRSVRDRAALHADLAGAHARAGRPDAAVEHARQARALAERIGSRAITAALSRSAAPTGGPT